MNTPVAKLGSGYGAVFSNDSQRIAIAPTTAPPRLISLDDLTQSLTLKSIKYPRNMVFSPCDQRLVVFGFDRNVVVFSSRSGEPLLEIKSKHRESNAHQVSHDGNLISIARVGQLALYSTIDGAHWGDLVLDNPEFGIATASAFSLDGTLFACAWSAGVSMHRENYLTLWDVKNQKRAYTVEVPVSREITSLHFDCLSDNSILLVSDESIVRVDCKNGVVLSRKKISGDSSLGPAILCQLRSAKKNLVAYGKVITWYCKNLSRKTKSIELNINDDIHGIAISPDEKRMVTCTGQTHLWML